MNSISKFKASLAIGFALLFGAGSPTAHAASESATENKEEVNFNSILKDQTILHVDMDGMMNLRFTQGPTPSLVLRGSKNALQNIVGYVENGLLTLKDVNNNGIHDYDVEVYLTLPDVVDFALHSTGNLDFNNTFYGEQLIIQAYGTGDVDIPDMSVKQFTAFLNGTGNLNCSGHAATTVIKLSGTGDVNANLTGEFLTSVESKGTGDVTIVGKANSANFLTEGPGNINARGFEAGDVTVFARGTGEITCYASKDFEGTKNSVSSVICYGGPRNRNVHSKGIVFPEVNEPVYIARERQKEDEARSRYADLISKRRFALATEDLRESGDYENGWMLIFIDGKLTMSGKKDNREAWHRNDMRIRTHDNGDVELIYISKGGFLVIDKMSKKYVESKMKDMVLDDSGVYVIGNGKRSKNGYFMLFGNGYKYVTYEEAEKLKESKSKQSHVETVKNRAEIKKNHAEVRKNLAEIEGHRAEIESNRAEIERSRVELARVRAELAREREALERQRKARTNRSIGSTTQSSRQTLDEARRKIHEKKQEQYRTVMEKAQQEYRQAMEKAQQEYRQIQQKAEEEYLKAKQEAEKGYNEIVESEYVETETSSGTKYSTEDNVELKYDTRANKWVMYIDGVKVERKVKSVSPSKKVVINKATRQVEKTAKGKTSKGRRQTGVWENGSERTIFFEDGGQVTIFTDENGRQRIINEE